MVPLSKFEQIESGKKMKKLIKATTLALVLGASFTATAAGYAVVDAGKVLQQLPQREAVGKKMSEEFQPRMAELKQLQKALLELDQKAKRDVALMTQQEKTSTVRKLKELSSQLERKKSEFDEDRQRRGQIEQNKLLMLVQKAVETVSQREGYDLVLAKQTILFVNPKLDISDKVIQELSK
ncbi:MAG: outer membrane protein [Moritella sp.]